MDLFPVSIKLETLWEEVQEYAEEHDGEIPEEMSDRLDALEMEKSEVISEMIRSYKNDLSDAELIDAEAKIVKARADELSDRAKAKKAHAERIKTILTKYANGEKYEDRYGKLSWGTSTSLKCDLPATALPGIFQRTKDPEIDKKELRNALKDGSFQVVLSDYLEAMYEDEKEREAEAEKYKEVKLEKKKYPKIS